MEEIFASEEEFLEKYPEYRSTEDFIKEINYLKGKIEKAKDALRSRHKIILKEDWSYIRNLLNDCIVETERILEG